MDNGSSAPEGRFDIYGFAGTLTDWVTDYRALLEGLVELRDLEDAADAVLTVLTVPMLRKMRLAWELWEAIAEGSGEDPEILLVERMPLDALETARVALWGEIWATDAA